MKCSAYPVCRLLALTSLRMQWITEASRLCSGLSHLCKNNTNFYSQWQPWKEKPAHMLFNMDGNLCPRYIWAVRANCVFLINSSFFSLNYNHVLSGKSLQSPSEERERKDKVTTGYPFPQCFFCVPAIGVVDIWSIACKNNAIAIQLTDG